MWFSQTVARELVHRAAVAEVLLTSAVRLDDDNFHVAAQIPRHHAFYGESRAPRGTNDPMLLLEASRQACILIAHNFCAVPFGQYFIMRGLEFEVTDRAGLAVGTTPADTLLDCRITRRFRGRAGLAGLRVHCTSIVDGRNTASAAFDFAWVPAQRWDSMRAANRAKLGLPELPVAGPAPERIAADLVDRRDPYNVVISPLRTQDDHTWRTTLVIDTTHPTLFDHPLDHVPGMLQLEAFRQLAIATVRELSGTRIHTNQLSAFTGRFLGFGEFDLPNECEAVRVTAAPSADIELRCAMTQGENVIAEATLRLAHSEAGFDRATLPSLSGHR